MTSCTPNRGIRIEPELLSGARSHPELADASISTLVRIGLALLADLEDLGVPVASLRCRYGDRSHARLTGYSRPALTPAQLQQRGSQ